MAPNRTQGDAQQRVICPNCHANNFAGQRQCWQCRASLPAVGGPRQNGSPASAAAPPAPVAAPPGRAQAGPANGAFDAKIRADASSRPSALLVIGVTLMTFVIVLLATRSQNAAPDAGNLKASAGEARQTPADLNTAEPGAAAPNAGEPGTDRPADREDGAGRAAAGQTPVDASAGAGHDASVAPNGGDALEDAAKRVIRREAPGVGLPPPAAVSPDGQVHLRSGGTISADEWNEARRKLQESPLLKEPTSPPPF